MVEVTCPAEYFVPFSSLLHKTTLCVILTRPLDLSSALSAPLSGACTFLRKKYSYLDVAPEPLAFRNEELEGLLEFSFG